MPSIVISTLQKIGDFVGLRIREMQLTKSEVGHTHAEFAVLQDLVENSVGGLSQEELNNILSQLSVNAASSVTEHNSSEVAHQFIQNLISSLQTSYTNHVSSATAHATVLADLESSLRLYTDQKTAAIVGSSPEVLNTLEEFSAALGGDPDLRNTLLGLIGQKINFSSQVGILPAVQDATVTALDTLAEVIAKLIVSLGTKAPSSDLALYSRLASQNVFTKSQSVSMTNLGNCSGTVTLDMATCTNVVKIRLVGNVTIAKPINSNGATNLTIIAVQDGIGGHVLLLDDSFYVTNGEAPVAATRPNGRDLLSFVRDTEDDIWIGGHGVRDAL